MLNTLILVSFICWILGFVINGFTLYNVLLLIPTVMFALKKLAIHVESGNILVFEIVFLVFSTLWRLLFKKFFIIKYIISIVIRIIFIGIVYYDEKMYVYTTEERKKL